MMIFVINNMQGVELTVSKNVLGTLGICVVFLISGCGGGGGSSDTGSSNLPSIDAPALDATVENGTEAADIVLGAEGYGSVGLLASSSEKVFDPFNFTMAMNKQINSLDFKSYALNETYSDTYQCTDGGQITYTSSSSSSSLTATINYDKCSESNTTMNGKISVTATGDLYNAVYTSEKITFSTDFTATYTGTTVIIHGGSFYQYDYTLYDWNNELYKGTLKTSLWVDDGTDHFRYDDLTVAFEDDYYNNGTSIRCYKAGRVYINNLSGYLDIDSSYDPSCNDPFVWSYYQLQSGSMEFIGSNSSRVHVEANATTGYYTVTVVE